MADELRVSAIDLTVESFLVCAGVGLLDSVYGNCFLDGLEGRVRDRLDCAIFMGCCLGSHNISSSTEKLEERETRMSDREQC